MNLKKSLKREATRYKKKNGMQITGRSIFVIVETTVKKSKNKHKIKGKKK